MLFTKILFDLKKKKKRFFKILDNNYKKINCDLEAEEHIADKTCHQNDSNLNVNTTCHILNCFKNKNHGIHHWD